MRHGVLPAAVRRLLATSWMVVPAACFPGGGGPSECSPASTSGDSAYVSAAPQQVAQALGRGINFGNMFDAPFDGAWDARYDPGYVDLVSQAGFSHIRLPVRWSNHATATADAVLDETFACRIDGVIDLAISKGLYVVMDMHHYRQLDGDPTDPGERAVDAAVVDQRLVSIWTQLAARYRAKSNRLVYEIYNEPHNRLTPDLWNPLAGRALAAIRQSDPQRVVMLGGTSWYAAAALPSLQLPDDPNLIVTVHNYDPTSFTFQGNPGYPVGGTCCTADQQQPIRAALDLAAAYGAAHGYPVYLGEFGSSVAADPASRVAYARFVRDQAEARGMPWAVWSLINMGVYDATTSAWREDLKAALLGP